MTTSKRFATLLSEREREILKLLSDGYSTREISQRLMIPVRALDDLCDGVMRKLAIKDEAGLVKYAIKQSNNSVDR